MTSAAGHPAGRIAVATMAWARNADEHERLRRALTRLAATGLPVAVADAGTDAAFSSFLGSLPGCRVGVPAAPGLVPQVKTAIRLAAQVGTPYVFYTEPDKEEFFEQALGAFLARALQAPDAGVVLAARSARSFATFPPMQQYTEGVLNHLCGDLVGRAGDYCYGPFLMPRTLVGAVEAADAGLGWGWRPFVFRAARRAGLAVAHVVGEYACPADQRMESGAERMHRVRQLSQNLLGLTA